jgi:hypothetical protein
MTQAHGTGAEGGLPSQMHDRDKIESTYAELEIARLLYTKSSASFAFRTPIGIKKEDYDLAVTYDTA